MYTYFLLQILTAVVAMRPIALVSVALAVSASALPRVVLGRDLGHNARGAGGLEKKQANNDSDPQTSLGKSNGS